MNNYIFTSISTLKTGLLLLGVVHLNSPLAEKLGRMLLSLVLLVSIPLWMAVIFTLNLLLLIVQILMKLVELLKNIVQQDWNVQSTSCQWEDDQKNTTSTYKRWRTSVLKEAGDLHQDSTLVYSEMPGELNEIKKYARGIHSEEQYEKLRKHL